MSLLKVGFNFALILLGSVMSAGTGNAEWVTQSSGTSARLRGVSAVSRKVAWASGDKGTFARTVDGGETWRAGVVPGAEALDFRDVDAFDASTAYLLAIGAGEKSRIYKTTDGGKLWRLQFTNSNPQAFFDAMAFWDKDHGIAVSDPVDGRFVIIRTTDGGATWQQMPAAGMPSALTGEGAFAASGTCIAVQGKTDVWFGTGGGAQARVFHSTDGGRTWTVSQTPLAGNRPPAGVFSIVFMDKRKGVIVGGDYEKETEAERNVAVTSDGGETWQLITDARPAGYRSCVARVPGKGARTLVAVGPTGSDYSLDDGRSWSSISRMGFHSASFTEGAGWAVGEKGLIAKYVGPPPGAAPARAPKKG